MNVVFWFLVIIVLIGLWFAGYELYGPIGRMIDRMIKHSKDAMDENGTNKIEEEEKKD